MSMNSNRFRHALLGASAMVSAAAVASAAYAADTRAYDFDMPAQPLTLALKTFGATADQQLIFSESLVKGRTAPALRGSYTPDQALAMLLSGSGLTADKTPGGVVTIRSASNPQSGSAADGADGTVQALIVTAQKREEDIQDVPIAISAFTQEDLTRSQVAGGPDLITQVPNMTFTKTNFSSYSIQLRGIGTQAISATTDPGVAVAFNNTPFTRNRFFEQEFYDLQRVEVLRGPQGTLYGRNATAGVVNIISAKPKFSYEAKLSGDVSNYSSSRLEGMVNVPLVEDKVALRLAGAWTKRDGYATNELSGQQIDGRDLWSTRLSLRFDPTDSLSANLIWEHFEENDDRLRSGKQLCKKDVVTDVGGVPITNYFDTSTSGGQSGAVYGGVQAALSQGCTRNSLYAKDSFQRPNGLMLPYYVPLGAIGLPTALNDPYVSVAIPGECGQNFCDPNLIGAVNDQPEDLRVIQSTVAPDYRANTDIVELQISYDLPDTLTLSSETAYSGDFVYSLQDFNRFNTAPGAWRATGGGADDLVARHVLDENGVFCDPQLGCSDRLVAVDIATARAHQFSQEFRLASDYDGSFNFSLGANFMRADSVDKYYVFINSLSLITAASQPFVNIQYDYVAGVTDNAQCLRNGYEPGDPNGVYPVAACVYMDPNPIGSVNDQGHNYFLSKNPYKLISYAVFGEAYYNIAENLKLTAGLRWTVDRKEAPRVPTWLVAAQSYGYPVAEVIEQEWREPTGRLTLDWKPDLAFTDETLLYASAAHGYKAGGANPPGYVRVYYTDPVPARTNSAESATRPRTFDPEFVNAFELGAKNTLLGGSLTANLAAFYYDYTGYQISEIVDRSAFNRNFDATVWGVELESDWRPIENLRFGLKIGYEKTRIKDGEQAIDLMDRTAGNPNWLVVRPFPTFASSCILPTYVFANPDGTIGRVGGVGGGGPSGCEIAYDFGHDPVTNADYVDLTQNPTPTLGDWENLDSHPGYPGFDPATAPNGGEGIMKQLGGNALPNAPEWTATITGDYTIPLPNEWLATLHTDLHWQSQSWWRVFNDHVYDKLHPYFTMNLAAIFTNEEAGWNIMAYIKNVTDETAITGAFLNSDDTGLTTNVFLTEPRLYGLRVTKEFSGGPWWTGASADHVGPYPLTVELSGQVIDYDAPVAGVSHGFEDAFADAIDVGNSSQRFDLDRGDSREVKLTYRPGKGPWTIYGGLRYGRTNGTGPHERASAESDPVCGFAGAFAWACDKYGAFDIFKNVTRSNFSDTRARQREEYEIAEFGVGRDFGIGGVAQSVELGLRHASLESRQTFAFDGIPDWHLENGFFFPFPGIPTTHHRYSMSADVESQFSGAGPVLQWDAALPLLGDDSRGQVAVDWKIAAGVLFGKQETSISGSERLAYYSISGTAVVSGAAMVPATDETLPLDIAPRSKDVTTPLLDVSLGVSYEVGRVKVGGGYRWERYYNVLDTGYAAHESDDRTIDGPYFKIAVGFGG